MSHSGLKTFLRLTGSAQVHAGVRKSAGEQLPMDCRQAHWYTRWASIQDWQVCPFFFWDGWKPWGIQSFNDLQLLSNICVPARRLSSGGFRNSSCELFPLVGNRFYSKSFFKGHTLPSDIAIGKYDSAARLDAIEKFGFHNLLLVLGRRSPEGSKRCEEKLRRTGKRKHTWEHVHFIFPSVLQKPCSSIFVRG